MMKRVVGFESSFVKCLKLPLRLRCLSWQRPVQLGDLTVDERTQSFFEFIVVPLQLSVVLLLIWSNQAFVLSQSILTPLCQKRENK